MHIYNVKTAYNIVLWRVRVRLRVKVCYEFGGSQKSSNFAIQVYAT